MHIPGAMVEQRHRSRAGGSSDRQLRRAGTNTSSTVKSWLPVPRMPITDHVSTMVTDSLGTHSARSNGAPAGRATRRVAVHHDAGAVQPARVLDAAGEVPPPRDAIAARHLPGPATRPRRAGAAIVGRRAGQLAPDLDGQAADIHRQRGGDHRAPAHRTIGFRQFLDHAERDQWRRLGSAHRARQIHLVDAGPGDLGGEVGRRLAHLFRVRAGSAHGGHQSLAAATISGTGASGSCVIRAVSRSLLPGRFSRCIPP